MYRQNILSSIFAFCLIPCFVFGQNTWSITESLDSDGKYILSRNVNIEKKTIEFEVYVETTGFVGFGLSPNGGMAGADIVIGGVRPDRSTYFTDRHATGTVTPMVDERQDWFLTEATENTTHTTLKFYRIFDTCDTQDMAIGEDSVKLIWSYGLTDDIVQHTSANRGSKSVNLLDPPMPSEEASTHQVWSVTVDDIMPPADTSYWCTLHKTPTFAKPQHIVGFDAVLENPEAKAHTHHFILYKCSVAEGEDAAQLLEPHVGQPGVDCDQTDGVPNPLRQHCKAVFFVWAVGGQRTMLPNHVGLPVGETNDAEYFMLEIHYDNPLSLPNLKFVTGMEIYYTPTLRPEIAGIMTIGHLVAYTHTIPPDSPSFTTVGHCSSECTTNFLGEGINVFNILLHSHYSGRKLRLRHFRGDEELSWVGSDQNYDFNYQQNRPIRKEVIIKAGDHLTYECVTDTTWKNGKLTIGDLKTTDEMCEAFIMYYPRTGMDVCSSTYPTKNILEDFGMDNFTAQPGSYIPIVTGPENMAGKTYVEVLETMIDWTPDFRAEFQQKVITSDHDFVCGASINPEAVIDGTTNYPKINQEYSPVDECKSTGQYTSSSFWITFGFAVYTLFRLSI